LSQAHAVSLSLADASRKNMIHHGLPVCRSKEFI
jgi:hypothetical protein